MKKDTLILIAVGIIAYYFFFMNREDNGSITDSATANVVGT